MAEPRNIVLPANASIEQAEALRELFLPHLQADAALVVDFSRLERADLTLVQTLLVVKAELARLNATITFVGPVRRAVSDVFLYGGFSTETVEAADELNALLDGYAVGARS